MRAARAQPAQMVKIMRTNPKGLLEDHPLARMTTDDGCNELLPQLHTCINSIATDAFFFCCGEI